jgi:hypothetical protein
MAQQIALKNFSRKNYFNCGAFKSKNSSKSKKVSFYIKKNVTLNSIAKG